VGRTPLETLKKGIPKISTTTSTNSGTRTMTGTDILGTAVALRGTQMGTIGRLEGAGALAVRPPPRFTRYG
jgi:hypothetical protein